MANLKWLLLICASEALFPINAEYQWCSVKKWAAYTQCFCKGVRIGCLILLQTEGLFYTQQEGHLLSLKGAKVLLFLRKHNFTLVDSSLPQMKTDSYIFSTKRTVFNKYIIKTIHNFIFFSLGLSLLEYFDIIPICHYSHGQKCPHGRWFCINNGKPDDTFTYWILWLLCWPTCSGEGIPLLFQ